jgi:AraC-like DNA-binding protein
VSVRFSPAPSAQTESLSAEDIEQHPGFAGAIRRQASALLSIQAANPRLAAVFATQQRWLIAHICLAMHFEGTLSGKGDGLRASTILRAVVAHDVASRNTADAFIKEMFKYGYAVPAPAASDRRVRSIAVAPLAVETFRGWLHVHLSTLDALDDGGRIEAALVRPELMAIVHPRIAAGLLGSRAIREPTPTFSLFTWLNEGGIVMDWLCAGLEEAAPDCLRIPTKVASYADFSDRIRLSRSHLARKLRMAEDLGSLGWFGKRGRSTMWVSSEFLNEYHLQQAAKLAVIDSAFQHSIGAGGSRSSGNSARGPAER